MRGPATQAGESSGAATVRPARAGDAEAVARALYESSPGAYDIYAGDRDRALSLLAWTFGRPGNSTSREVVTVAEVEGRVAAAMAAFPVEEAPSRAWRFLFLSMRRLAPWRWPRTVGVFRTGARQTPDPPADSLYVDGLATLPHSRRRGAARALLAHAERRAREGGFGHLALDTTADNHDALALYLSAGFQRGEERPPAGAIPGVVGLAKPLRPDG